MHKFSKNKKLILALLVVFILLGGFFVLAAPQAKALDLFDLTGGTILKIVNWLLLAIVFFLGKLLALASGVLEAVFSISKFRNIPVVNIGWQITRGLCNMFFALILLVMAFSTILQIERFGMKQILKRLVIAALLINFSLLFAGILIDFSQVLTDYFIKEAGGTNKSISAQIMNGLNITRAIDANPDKKTVPIDFCGGQCNSNEVCQAFPEINEYGCVPAPNPDTNPSAKLQQGDPGAFQVTIGLIFSVILVLIASFVILAAAVFMIFRIVMLWLLLIFAPLAWMSMITGTGGLWGQWWGLFFKWTFFAPIYAFFIYLAVLAVGSGSFGQAFQQAKGIDADTGILNSLAGGSVTLILQYIVIVIILLGGLIVAQKMGIAGASTAMSIAKKASGKVQGWATGSAKWTGKQAMRAPKFAWNEKVAPGLTNFAGKTLSSMGLKKLGGRTQAAAIQMKQKPEERPENKAYAAQTKLMSDKDLLHETKAAWGARSLIAAREAKERGALTRTDDREVVKKAMQTFQAYGVKDDKGKTKEQKELEELRPDAVDEKDLPEVIRRAKESGNLEKMNSSVFGKVNEKGEFVPDETGQRVMSAMQQELKPPEFVETYKKMGKKSKEAMEKTMASAFDTTNNFSDPKSADTINRNLYATATGKIAVAFKEGAKEFEQAAENAAGEFIRAMKPSQIGDIFHGNDVGKDSLKMVGRHINVELMSSLHGELNGSQKALIAEGARKTNNTRVITFMDNSPAWGGRMPNQRQEEQGQEEKPRRPAGFRT